VLDMLMTIIQQKRKFQIAHVDVYSGYAFLWTEASCTLLRILKKPYILTLHGGNLPSFVTRWPRRVRLVLNSARTVTAPSSYLLEAMLAYCTNIYLLPNPIDLNLYSYRQRQLPITQLIWLRAFHHIYNPSLAPKVLALLKKQGFEIHLKMIGPDKGDGSLDATQRVIREFGLELETEIIPGIPKEEVPTTLKKNDIFVNTTSVDNTPVSVIEAMACGLCIVSTNVGGIPYLLEDGKDALLVPPDDPELMATAIRRILIEPGLAEKLSINARRKAEQFDWSVILPQWEKIFDEIVKTND
jgi:glycosyltransferase involved in cell wall biosynthesis